MKLARDEAGRVLRRFSMISAPRGDISVDKAGQEITLAQLQMRRRGPAAGHDATVGNPGRVP